MTGIFQWFFMWKMDPISGFDVRLVFTLTPRDNTLQYKRCVHFWNDFICIITLTWSTFLEIGELKITKLLARFNDLKNMTTILFSDSHRIIQIYISRISLYFGCISRERNNICSRCKVSRTNIFIIFLMKYNLKFGKIRILCSHWKELIKNGAT